MKQLVCEMCGGTDWAKEDGMFVCQGCGMKYSAEEAKKMMTEVEGTPTSVSVKNAAQLENLLNLAQSSYDSKNYAQAEAFCNQVIAMDSTNFDAWLLKGRAINYQINAKNQRILEVYNCIMTAYQVLDDAGKKKNAKGILSILKTCFEGEVDFWLQQFEAARPSDATLLRAKNAYVEAYNKMADAYIEMGLKRKRLRICRLWTISLSKKPIPPACRRGRPRWPTTTIAMIWVHWAKTGVPVTLGAVW